MSSRKSPKLSRSDLRKWLDLLAGSSRGKIKLINMLLSREHNLVSEAVLCSFLADCISQRASTVHDALKCYSHVCNCDDKHFMLAAVSPTSINGTCTLVITLNSLTFHRYILGRPKTIVRSVLPDKPESPSDHDEKIYCDALKKATAYRGWYKDASTLGRPFPDPIRVWFSEFQDLESEIEADSSRNTKGSKARDALGLIDTKDGTYLLSVQLPSTCLHTITDLKMARPGFADEGNARFAVHLDNAPKHTYHKMWGLTVHLKKLRDRSSMIHGVPERVCSSIQLSQVGDSISVRGLGWVSGNRGEVTGIDDDGSFFDRLRGKWTVATIIGNLLELGDRP